MRQLAQVTGVDVLSPFLQKVLGTDHDPETAALIGLIRLL